MTLAYFTPVAGSVGGALIGLAAGSLLLISGEILGVSGIVASTILFPRKALSDPSFAWKLALVSAFLLLSNTVLGAYFTDDERLGEDTSIPVVSVYGYLLGGFFSGFGSRLGDGCTAGHGICGMPRLSIRSTAAVCMFMLGAISTAMLTAPNNKATSNGTAFLRTEDVPELFNRWLGFGFSMIMVVPTSYALFKLFRKPAGTVNGSSDNGLEETLRVEDSELAIRKPEIAQLNSDNRKSYEAVEGVNPEKQPAQQSAHDVQMPRSSSDNESRRKVIPGALSGAIFAVGLAISGMVLPSKNFGFLNFLLLGEEGAFDPTLVTVMAGGCIVSFAAYQFTEPFGVLPNRYAQKCPLVAPKFSVPSTQVIDAQLLLGGICFGVGWGIGGLCPGPALLLAATGAFPVVCCWWPAWLVGSFVGQAIKR